MTGGILSGPAGQRFGGFRRLLSGEEAPLRASKPRRAAASPWGLHGSGHSAGARGARAGGGAAARGQGRCLWPTSELSSGRPPLALALALLSRSKPAPEARRGARGPVRAHPRLEPVRRPRAPGSRPGRHLPEPKATSSSSQTLPPARPARGGSPSPASGVRRAAGEQGRGPAATQLPALARAAPQPARGLEQPGGGRGRAEPGPTSAPARAPPTAPRALTPLGRAGPVGPASD